MPSNPQVPREVAEAKGKGAATLAVLGISLAAIGLAAVLVGVSVASSGAGAGTPAQAVAPAQMLPAGVESQPGNYLLCADAKDVFFYPDKGVTKVRVPMHRECWSGWISAPIEWDWELETVERKGVDIWFFDGERKWLGPDVKTPWVVKRGVFRARGEGDIVVWIHNGPEDKERKRLEDEAVRTGRPPNPNAAIGGTRLFPEPVQEEIATVVATNFLSNFLTIRTEKGERNVNPHNNPLYVKAPNGAWQFAMWWKLEAGDKIRLVWDGSNLQRMELVENVRERKDAGSQVTATAVTTQDESVPNTTVVRVLETNFLSNFLVVETEHGRQEIHPHNAPLYVKSANGSWQIAMWSSLEAGDKIRLVWRENSSSELERMELVESVRSPNAR